MLIDGKGLVKRLRSEVSEVSCATVNQHINNKQQLLFIDIREPAETALGFAAGSELIPRGVLEMQLSSSASYQALIKQFSAPELLPIYLICRSGARSVLAAHSLQQMGYKNVHSVEGGFLAWKEQGLAIESV